MDSNTVSPGIPGHGARGVLSATEQHLFSLLARHELPEIITHASGSPSQRLTALIADLTAHVRAESDAASKVLLDGIELHDFAVCAVRPIADCGMVFPREGDRDAHRRVVVIDPRTEDDAEPVAHVCCSEMCAETLLRSWRQA